MINEALAREEYARHVVAELGDLAPEAGEEETLAERRQRLMQLERAAEEVRDADEILNGPMAPGPTLAGLMRRLIRKADAGAAVFQPMVEALDTTLVALDATSDALETLKREMAFDPADLERVEERLFALRAAARKHQTTCDGLSTCSPATRPIWRCCRAGKTASRRSRPPPPPHATPTSPPPAALSAARDKAGTCAEQGGRRRTARSQARRRTLHRRHAGR